MTSQHLWFIMPLMEYATDYTEFSPENETGT